MSACCSSIRIAAGLAALEGGAGRQPASVARLHRHQRVVRADDARGAIGPTSSVSRVGVPDIDGYELCSIVRNDPSMTGVLFLLLASPGDEAPEADARGEADQTLAGDLPLSAIVAEVRGLLRDRPRGPPRPPAAPVEGDAGDGRLRSGSWTCRRSRKAVALGGKTGGAARSRFRQGRGVIVFDHGRVVHARFFELIGETAFAALMVAARTGRRAANRMGAPSSISSRTARPTGRGRFTVTSSSSCSAPRPELDEGRAGAATAPLS